MPKPKIQQPKSSWARKQRKVKDENRDAVEDADSEEDDPIEAKPKPKPKPQGA